MEPKPSRKPTRLSLEGHNSLSAPSSGTKKFYESRSNGLSDFCATRETPNKMENEIQESQLHHNSHGDFPISEPECSEHLLKLSTAASAHDSGCERPWPVGFSGNRNRMFSTSDGCHLSTPFQSTLYNETERLPGASSRFLTSQNGDSKRPKLVSTGSPRNGADCESNNSDSMWRCSQFPRSSAMQFSSTSRGETILREGIEMERRTESSREEDVENRVLSYAQGARPRHPLLGSLRRTTSSLSQVLSSPSESRSVFSRDSSRSSSTSSNNSTAFSNIEVIPQRSTECGFILSRTGSGASEAITSQRRNMSVLQPRPPNDFASESSSRCRPRQLLSRLASSMSSTFSSNRRPNQGHPNGRSFETTHSIGHSANISLGGRPENFTQANSSGRHEAANFSNNRSSESSQGFGFLRWRRPGPSNISQSQNANDGVENLPNLRQDYSENRNTASWLSSSLRNRCTPLFNRRRREGRDETARMAATPSNTINEARVDQRSVLQREFGTFENSNREQPNVTQGATAASSGALSSTFCTPSSVPESPRGRSTSGIAGIFPNSVIRLSMPYGLGDEFSDNILIAVDFANHVDTHQEKQKTESASRDPEKLRKIQESLLLEDSDDDEGDICRICQMGAGATIPPNPLIQPCNCTGSLQHVHQECMKKWLQSKINSGADLTAVTTCELCKEKLQLDFEDFDVHELYRTHADEQAQYEFISSGLYLVLLLHLCEQRFSDMMGGASESRTRLRFIHLARTLQQHIQDLETTCSNTN
ncbi:E3 ubiquitin-protein ligase MARCH7 isoform X2 [Rhincodon typus]|uniref:E3 ubiquitin-protein ligase MARCH7 isoform X2 n=1 Tax=Rhincodon typus TaxID=259920 RepID=UPI00202FCE53|nr:E3 ubiquitin-protein ligase MARCH7 isoform X2 [Rhincodon typus]